MKNNRNVTVTLERTHGTNYSCNCCLAPVSVGGIIAGILSYAMWHDVVWCILHMFCGWFYVIYHLIKY